VTGYDSPTTYCPPTCKKYRYIFRYFLFCFLKSNNFEQFYQHTSSGQTYLQSFPWCIPTPRRWVMIKTRTTSSTVYDFSDEASRSLVMSFSENVNYILILSYKGLLFTMAIILLMVLLKKIIPVREKRKEI